MTDGGRRRSLPWGDLLVAAGLFAGGIGAGLRAAARLDLDRGDEMLFLRWSVTPREHLPAADWGPLYIVWYRMLGLFRHDPIALYFLGEVLLAAIPGVFLYAVLRRCGRLGALPSAAAALLFATSGLSLLVTPRPPFLALAVILATFLAASAAPSLPSALFVASTGAFAASYVRPEYSSVAVLLVLAGTAAFFRARDRVGPADAAIILGANGASAALLLTLWAPRGFGRVGVAFGQHFTLNWVSWTGAHIDPWASWREVMTRAFGRPMGPLEALSTNRALVLKHLAANARHSVSDFGLLLPAAAPAVAAGLAVIAVGLFATALARGRAGGEAGPLPRLLVPALAILFAAPSLGARLIIYPRGHYLVAPFALAIVLAATIRPGPRRTTRPGAAAAIALAAALLPPLAVRFPPEARPNLATARFLRDRRFDGPQRVLSFVGDFTPFLGPGVPAPDAESPDDVDAVLVSTDPADPPRSERERAWRARAASPPSGFRALRIPGTARVVLLRTG